MGKQRRILLRVQIGILVFFSFLPFVARADWINLSGAENAPNIAEIYINDDHVVIQLEVYIDDLMVFEELIPDNLFSQPIPGRPDLQTRLEHFADRTFQVITETGEKLPIRLNLVEPRMRKERPSPFAGMINPYTRMPIPGPPDDKRVLYAELIYPFKDTPKSLSFVPPIDDKGLPLASIGFICYHRGVPVVDFRHLTDENIVNLDWADPWYSVFTKKQLKRKLQSGMRTYLYIEPYEVRHEILVRVKDMMTWMEFDLKGNEFIEEDEFNPVREQVAQFFMEREKVLIDGKKLKPILDKTAYVESSMLRSRFIEIPERVPLNTAMIGIVITYLTDGIPQEVSAEWDLFSDRVQKVTARMTDPAGPFPYDLEPDDNILQWTNYLKNYTIPTVDNVELADEHKGVPVPLGSAVCLALLFPVGLAFNARRRKGQAVKSLAGLFALLILGAMVLFPFGQVRVGAARASQISEDDGKAILNSLLKNIYRAFDFREESDVYDKLAISVDGDLLADIYLQHRKSFAVQQAGGAQATVEEIDVQEVLVADSTRSDNALDFKAKWTAVGTVGHWGHIHTRQNQYEAVLTMKSIDGAWKITGLELLEEKRIDPFAKQQETGAK
jgi:hypothetical protein